MIHKGKVYRDPSISNYDKYKGHWIMQYKIFYLMECRGRNISYNSNATKSEC